MIGKKESFLKDTYKDRTMQKEAVVARPSGLSVLTHEEFVKYEGKCLGIVDGKVKFHSDNANEVVKALLAEKSSDKVFTSIPRSNVVLVK